MPNGAKEGLALSSLQESRKQTETVKDSMATKRTIKLKIRRSAKERQPFDGEEAKRDALSMFDPRLNTYQRGPDNKWRKTRGKP